LKKTYLKNRPPGGKRNGFFGGGRWGNDALLIIPRELGSGTGGVSLCRGCPRKRGAARGIQNKQRGKTPEKRAKFKEKSDQRKIIVNKGVLPGMQGCCPEGGGGVPGQHRKKQIESGKRLSPKKNPINPTKKKKSPRKTKTPAGN